MMTKTQVEELESNFAKFKLKKFFKKVLVSVFALAFCGFGYFGYESYKKQENALNLAKIEHKKIQKRLEDAKIAAKKAEILSQKRQKDLQNLAKKQENLTKDLTKKPKFKIISHEINPKVLKKAFYKKRDLNTALHLAHFHLNEQNYEKAIFWSFKANELNKNEPNAWLIFAKAKFAQGKKDEARKVLKNYINFYGNNFNEDVDYMLK